MANMVVRFLQKQSISTLILGGSLVVLGASVLAGLTRFAQMSKVDQTLSQQLATIAFELSKDRRNAAIAKEQEEALQRRLQDEKERNARYYSEVPLVISTPDGKGKLVGFSRLAEPGGSSQYSFIVRNGEAEVTVSGTISNQAGKLVYSDDYSTSSDVRTSGEVTHGKPSGNRLRLDFVVISAPSDKYRVGDTFYATFVLPGLDGGSI